ncbi:MAG: BamA/TamA family outer membrane protein [Polyangiaceae bacterium]|nr:BamA/TamA family outer membrane protein [Polyangiaceae bacterium]
MTGNWIRAAVVSFALAAAGCQVRPVRAPGETDILVRKVEILPTEGQPPLSLPVDTLLERLGMRPGSLILVPRRFSEFREAEDRRRIEAYYQQYGYFDVNVKLPEEEFSADRSQVALTFRVNEGERYTIGEVHLAGPPKEETDKLLGMIPFTEGETKIDLEQFRKVRITMSDHLRAEGYGHANVYSRSYVDKKKRLIHWYYFVDAGPKTNIGSIKVDGHVKVSAEKILERSGMAVGDLYRETLRDTVVRDLLDSGSFASVFVRTDSDTKFIAPGTAPDTGGELRDEQVDKDGNFVPRKLPGALNLTIHVVEAPSRTLRVRGGFEIDPARADATLGATAWFRNVFAPMHHLVLEGRLGYGILFDQNPGQPNGPYGEALIRTVHSGVLGRMGDLRLSARLRTALYPDAYLTELSAGPGVRATLGKGVFFDTDLLAVYGLATNFSNFSEGERQKYALPSSPESFVPELSAALRWDARDNPVETKSGHYLGVTARFAPGAPVGTHRYLNVAPEARGYLPITSALSVAGRAFAEWSFLNDSAGVPLGARLFGGGAYGFRGEGRQRLSPVLQKCVPFSTDLTACSDRAIGGLSLFELSAELRFLPVQKQYGVVLFGDLGGAGPALNPFEEGPSFAAGLGLRLRIWYLPISVDVAYRALSRGQVQDLNDNPVSAFARIGEAF